MVNTPVATRPSPPPLESEASEVASRHLYSRIAQPDSRRAVTSCASRIVETPSPDGPADSKTFRTRTGRPVRVPRDVSLPVVLLPDRRNTRHRRTGTQLAAVPSQVCNSPSEPSRTDTVQDQGGRGADPARGAILAHPDLVPRADAPRDRPSLADSSEEGSTDSETGHLLATASRPLETSCLVPGWDVEVLVDQPQEVVHHHFGESTVYEICLHLEVEPVRGMVLFSQRRPPEMPDQSRAVLLAARVSLHPQSLRRRLLPTTTLWKGSWWGSMTGSSGSLRGLEGLILHAPLYTLLGPVSSAQSTTAGPVRAFADSRAKVPLNENSAPACTGLH